MEPFKQLWIHKKKTVEESRILLWTDNSHFLPFSVLLQSTLLASRTTLVSSTAPQSQNPVHHSDSLPPILTNTHYPTFALRCSSHTHSVACRHKTALFFSCQSYLVLKACLGFSNASLEQRRSRYTSYLLLVPEHSGGMISWALRETMLPGATALLLYIYIYMGRVAQSV